MSLPRAVLPVLLLLFGAGGCASEPSVELAGKRYVVEIADSDAERARGLMFRDAMPADHGMLFIHDAEEPQAYWMKNCKFPQDMLFFDNHLKLVAQQRDVPPCSAGDACPAYPSNKPARYVLELNAGQAAQLNLQDGAELKLGKGIIAPKD